MFHSSHGILPAVIVYFVRLPTGVGHRNNICAVFMPVLPMSSHNPRVSQQIVEDPQPIETTVCSLPTILQLALGALAPNFSHRCVRQLQSLKPKPRRKQRQRQRSKQQRKLRPKRFGESYGAAGWLIGTPLVDDHQHHHAPIQNFAQNPACREGHLNVSELGNQ